LCEGVLSADARPKGSPREVARDSGLENASGRLTEDTGVSLPGLASLIELSSPSPMLQFSADRRR